jgi:hypothetical protein
MRCDAGDEFEFISINLNSLKGPERSLKEVERSELETEKKKGWKKEGRKEGRKRKEEERGGKRGRKRRNSEYR